MDTATAFEWELSKENISRLRGGRSVGLLNKVLSSLNTEEFQDVRNHLKQLFELKLANLPNSFVKLRLYLRYIHWIEQTHPTLHRSVIFETLLFRCVRDCGQLPNVKNDEDFVDVWIRLTEYCDQPGELFELLFRQGVGTMCAKFYEAWASWLSSHSQLAHAAAVYAHGLRAGAQPLFHLEDHAELFVARLYVRLAATNATDSDLGADFPAPSNVTNRLSSRQTLAALSLVQRESDPDRGGLKVPAVRTSRAWDADQSGLRSLKNLSISTDNSRAVPRVKRKLVSIASDMENDAVAPLYTLPAIPHRTNGEASEGSELPVRPLGHPSDWQKENLPKTTTWVNQKLSSIKGPSSTRRSQPDWHVYSDEVAGDTAADGSTREGNQCSSPKNNPAGNKRKGLVVLREASQASSLTRSAARLVNVITFTHFLDASTTLSTTQTESSECATVLQCVDLPCLPPNHSSEDTAFGFPLTFIYGGTEELCWEMHRGALWISAAGDSVSLNAPTCRDDWDAESGAILNEITEILSGPDMPKLVHPIQSLTTDLGSNRVTLISDLEQIASGKRPIQKTS